MTDTVDSVIFACHTWLHMRTWNPSKLVEARNAKGMSQEALSRALTVAMNREAQPVRARNVVRWEKARELDGSHTPSADFIPALASVLDQPESYFFGDEVADDQNPFRDAA